MKKISNSLRSYRILFLGTLFLGFMVMLLPLFLEKILLWSWYGSNSINTTKYIYVSYLGFFIILLGILIPLIQKISRFLKLRKVNLVDGLTTIVIFLVSFIPLLVLTSLTLFLLKRVNIKKYGYRVFNWAVSIALFLIGIRINFNGERSKTARIFIINHSSPVDYLLMIISMGIYPYNIVAGINLKRNKKTLEDKLISFTLGNIIKNYAIAVDRSDSSSRISVLTKTEKELKDGKNVLYSPSDGRLSKAEIKKGKILKEFKRGAFGISWNNKIPIQPIVYDWPAIYRGKGDDWWGVHPCTIDIYYLPEIKPDEKNELNEDKYKSLEEFQAACFESMEKKLKSSKKVQNFLKEIQN